MMKLLNRRETLLALVLLLACNPAASAEREGDDDDHDHVDHEEALRALQEGQAKPLAEILENLRKQLGGDVIGVEFEGENGHYVYEIKIIAPDGRLNEVHVDAMTGAILPDGHD